MTTETTRVPVVELKQVSRRFGATPDALGRLAVRMGLSKPPPVVRAVDRVDLSVYKGEVVGLVGESGCGKSTLGRMVAGLLPVSDGDVFWNGRDVASLDAEERRKGSLQLQMVFQNPFASLNPRMPVSEIVGEAPRVHNLTKGIDHDAYVDEQLRRAGLDPALKGRYAHQFSGGQRQRIGIARALAVNPDFLVCDEAVAALDVSIQAQILNLFLDLREQLALTYLFISHDLGVVRHLSDRVAIMYLGRIVEEAPAAEVFSRPNHPYTQALLEEMPRIDTQQRDFPALKGELPSPLNPPTGCHFHPRCPHAFERCTIEAPQVKFVAPGHRSACHLNDQI
ncbi:ABC transporter ATP-binding protein [Ramlibacter sp. WS9]|uniref:ABC transporter ATP-binding protein n=1 Tax=Ramlibacter sp. WS9 TaxID=1882741 RepID=UPI0011435658|nr:ABC transporter ATP-binding protein [Ramlibacter sp. WS9]ROZ79758.1 ABC transporter ATP-binding protein [Ramlibacter sp. WS9]